METKPRGSGLSPSSMNTYLACERLYYHKKVAMTPKDSDVEDDVESLSVGSAFHKCLEECSHDLSSYSFLKVDDVVRSFNLESIKHTPLIYAMLRKYKTVHDKSKLKAVACEIEVNTDTFYGFVDVVLVDPATNKWWIGDIKTAASYSDSLIPTLFNHNQLNLYASNHREVASKLALRPVDFAGCRYLLTTKARLVRKDGEEDKTYIDRLSKSVKSFDFVLPIERMNPHAIAANHLKVKDEIESKEGKIWEFKQNYQNCMAWHRPCENFSQCHGGLFSELRSIDVVTSE